MACFGKPVLSAASIKSGSTVPEGDRMADQMAFAKACLASLLSTTLGLGFTGKPAALDCC